jgi:hypothetical protein
MINYIEPFALSLPKATSFMVRQAVRVLLGRLSLTATAYPLRVHHERI